MTDHELNTTERLVRIETTLEVLKTRLLGNGQPGDLQKFDTRIDNLEESRSRVRGALWAIGLTITTLTGGLLHHLGIPGFR